VDFYFGRSSGNSARVAFVLHEAGVAYTPHPLDVPAGESRAPDYLALNPMGKVPALVDGTVRLWESNAINWYLAEKHPEARLVPASLEGRASVLRWLLFQAGHVTPACISVYRLTNARVRKLWQVTPDPHAAAAWRRELARYLPVLEEALAGREWFEGTFSLADIAYAPHLWMLAEGDLDGGFDLGPTPAVRAWLDRLLARPAWRRTIDLVVR